MSSRRPDSRNRSDSASDGSSGSSVGATAGSFAVGGGGAPVGLVSPGQFRSAPRAPPPSPASRPSPAPAAAAAVPAAAAAAAAARPAPAAGAAGAASAATSAAPAPPTNSGRASGTQPGWPGQPGQTSLRAAPPLSLNALAAYPGPGVASNFHGARLPGETTQAFIAAMKAATFTGHDSPTLRQVRASAAQINSRVWGLRMGSLKHEGLPQDYVAQVDVDVTLVLQFLTELLGHADKLDAELKKVSNEGDRLRALNDRERKEHAQYQNRVQACITDMEHDMQRNSDRCMTMEGLLASLQAQSLEDQQKLEDIEAEMKRLAWRNEFLQSQLDGRRHLWMQVHGDPQELDAGLVDDSRRNEQIARPLRTVTSGSHPFGAPTATGALVRQSQPAQAQQGLLPRPSGLPPRPAVHIGQGFTGVRNLGSGLAASRHSGITPSQSSSVSRALVPTATETGSPPERRRATSSALVKVETSIDHVDEGEHWANEFNALFAHIYGFCKNYFENTPKIEGDWRKHFQSEGEGFVWKHVCSIVHPRQERERGDYALSLLKNDGSRPYFIQRMILQLITAEVLTIEGWQDYSAEVDKEMKEIEAGLKTTDPFKTYERQALVDRRAVLVGKMAEGPKAKAFRNHKLNHHHQKLRAMVAPFIPKIKNDTTRDEAFFDLFHITEQAFDLSGKLLRSPLTFQFTWCDELSKFSADFQQAIGCNIAPAILQRDQWRVKLCATPAVTMRSDQGVSIRAKQIVKAGVMIMR